MQAFWDVSVCMCGIEEKNCVNAFSNICKNLNDVSSSFLGFSLQNNSLVDKDNGYSCDLCAFLYSFLN